MMHSEGKSQEEFREEFLEEFLEESLEDYVLEVADRLRNPMQVFLGHLENFDTSNFTEEQGGRFREILEAGRLVEKNIKVLTARGHLIEKMGRELRTPMTITKSALELARGEKDVKEREKLLKIADDAITHQNRMLDGIITTAQAEAAERISEFLRKKRLRNHHAAVESRGE